MIRRKRQRSTQCFSNDNTLEENAAPFAKPTRSKSNPRQSPMPSKQQLQQRERIRARRRRIVTTPSCFTWKVTMATILLLLWDNSHRTQLSPRVVQAWGGGNSTTIKKGELQVIGSCRREDFLVQAVYLVCDSPGAYYRGSSTYRDSTTCIYGDKARLQLEFSITDSFTGASSIRLEIESGFYGRWKRVAIMDNLCSYSGSNLQRIYTAATAGYITTACPMPGLYQLDTYFTVPAFTQDTELHYTPDVRFKFYSAKGRVLGCATTGTLAQNTIARQRAKEGLKALSIAFIVLFSVFSLLIYLNYGRERRLLLEKQKHLNKSSRPQQQMLSTTQTPMDHETSDEQAQRYHYFDGPDKEEFNGSSHTSHTSNAASSVDTRTFPRRI